MSLFHKISFTEADPLGAGLREEIVAEQHDVDTITLEEGIDDESLNQYWQGVSKDVENDPTWVHFENEES